MTPMHILDLILGLIFLLGGGFLLLTHFVALQNPQVQFDGAVSREAFMTILFTAGMLLVVGGFRLLQHGYVLGAHG